MKVDQTIEKASKLDSYHLHEFTDRVHMISSIICDHLLDHPLAKADEAVSSKLDEVLEILSDLYQYSGALHFEVAEIEPLLKEFRNDYQFDKSHEDYLGFLNTSPIDEWTPAQCNAWKYLINNHSLLLFGLLKKHGLRVEDGPNVHETIFYLDEE